MRAIKKWLSRRWFGLVCVLVIAVLLGTGVQVIDRGSPNQIGIGIGVGEKVITLCHVAYAAGSVDYTYDGVDDDVQWQAAMNALPATGGRLVNVSAVQLNFSATVTRAIDNVIIEGSGRGTYFTNDAVTPLFTAGGNNWKFIDLRTDAGSITMGATTGWEWDNVTINADYYAYRTPVASTSGADWEIPSGRGATLTVAASDADTQSIAQADYICDGTDDHVQFHAALDALPAGGGSIVFTDGTFEGRFGLDEDNVAVIGQGWNTILKLPDGTNDPAQVLTVVSDNCIIKDLQVDGNKSGQVLSEPVGNYRAADGIAIFADYVTVENCYVHSTQSHGIINYEEATNAAVQYGAANAENLVSTNRIGTKVLFNLVEDVSIVGNERSGIDNVSGKSTQIIGNRVIGGVSTKYGINLHEGERCIISNNTVSSCTDSCIVISEALGNNIITGNSATDSIIGIYIAVGGDDDCTDIIVGGNTIDAVTGEGIYVHNLSTTTGDIIDITISGNNIDTATTGIKAEVPNACSETIIGLNITGNTVNSSPNGIYVVRGAASAGVFSDINITGNSINNCVTNGIYTAYITRQNISSNTISGASLRGINMANYLDNMIISGNLVNAASQRGLLVDVGTAPSIISNNNISGSMSTAAIQLNAISSIQILGNVLENTSGAGVGIQITGGGDKFTISDNYFAITTGTILTEAGAPTNIKTEQNVGYIAPSEVRFASGALTAGVANAICFAWNNPEAQDILIKKVVIETTTAGGTGGSHLDVGIADDAAGTNRGVEFFDDLLLNTTIIHDSWVAGDGGTQTKWVFCQDIASAIDDWIVGQILDANAASLVGRWYIEYVGR